MSLTALTPEHLRREPLSHQSDLFALGLLYYRIFTGRHPFIKAGQLDQQAVLQHRFMALEDATQPYPDLPAGLSELVGNLLEPDPLERPSGTLEVRQRLLQIQRERVVAPDTSLAEEARDVFRPEWSPGPEQVVPADLARHGRSRLRPFQIGELWSWRSVPWRQKWMPLLALFVLLAIPLWMVQAWLDQQPGGRVHISTPDLTLREGSPGPGSVSLLRLQRALEDELEQHLGPLVINGESPTERSQGIRPLDQPERPAAVASERYALDIDCTVSLCVLNLRRDTRRLQTVRQAVLPIDASWGDWQSHVRRLSREVLAARESR